MTPVIALSDIHGQMFVFPALAKLRQKYPTAKVVFLGDYQDSLHHHTGLKVAQTILTMQKAEPEQIFVLQGNHDAALWESMTGINEYWLDADGEDVISEAVLTTGEMPATMAEATEVVRREYTEVIEWFGHLPLTLRLGKLLFVHAGLDLTKADPVAETSNQDKYWLREEYWYGLKHPEFARNPLDCAIITGHTPTSSIAGVYAGAAAPATLRNRTVSPVGVYVVQYVGEYARFFIDGGNHGGPAARIGNIAVFNADDGTLIEAVEDQEELY